MASNIESIISSLITKICHKATVTATKNVYETVLENVRKCHPSSKAWLPVAFDARVLDAQSITCNLIRE